MKLQAHSALVAGAISRDRIQGRSDPVAGGVVIHAGVTLSRLGLAVRVLTRLCPNDVSLLAPLESERIDSLALPSRLTTSYTLDYRSGRDRHELGQSSDPIGPDDVPLEWRGAQLAQLGPLHRRDLLPGVAEVLSGLVALDVQGLLREVGPQGTRLAPNSDLAAHLAGVRVLKASESELPFLLLGERAERFTARHGLRELLITRGGRGATVVSGRETIDVPAEPARGASAVGAGDAFLAAYLVLRLGECEPELAARGAARVAAAKIDHGQVPKGFKLEELCDS